MCLFEKLVTCLLFLSFVFVFTNNTELFAVQVYGFTSYCSVCVWRVFTTKSYIISLFHFIFFFVTKIKHEQVLVNFI